MEDEHLSLIDLYLSVIENTPNALNFFFRVANELVRRAEKTAFLERETIVTELSFAFLYIYIFFTEKCGQIRGQD